MDLWHQGYLNLCDGFIITLWMVKFLWRFGSLALCGDMVLWLSGDLDLWLSGDLDLWLSSDLDLWLSGDLDLLLSGDLDLCDGSLASRLFGSL